MSRKRTITKTQYAERAQKLRSLGFHLSYKGNKKSLSSPAFKSAVTRGWNRAVFYAVKTEEHRFEFKRYTKTKTRAKWESHVSPEQVFPGGVYIQRPANVEKGKYKLTLKKNGELLITTSDKRRIRDISLRLDMIALATDSKGELERVLKGKGRPRQLLLTTNGIEAGQSFEDLEQFNRYVEEELIPELQAAGFNFKKWGKRVFGLRLVYSSGGQKKISGEGKTFDFKTGSIFDGNKRIYGRKKFSDRKRYKQKQGKRKGT